MATYRPAIIAVDLPSHGKFSTTAPAMDLMIVRYVRPIQALSMDGQAHRLAAIVTQRTSFDYFDVREVSSLLVVLAELDGHSAESEIRRGSLRKEPKPPMFEVVGSLSIDPTEEV